MPHDKNADEVVDGDLVVGPAKDQAPENKLEYLGVVTRVGAVGDSRFADVHALLQLDRTSDGKRIATPGSYFVVVELANCLKIPCQIS